MQLEQLNEKVRENNRGLSKKMNEVSKNEFWKFIGIIIVASPLGKGGEKLWDRDATHRGFIQSVNFGTSK